MKVTTRRIMKALDQGRTDVHVTDWMGLRIQTLRVEYEKLLDKLRSINAESTEQENGRDSSQRRVRGSTIPIRKPLYNWSARNEKTVRRALREDKVPRSKVREES